MPAPRVEKVVPESPADRAGLEPGDEILAVNGVVPRDVIEWTYAVDEPRVRLSFRRGERHLETTVEKEAGEPLGTELASALFDRVRTCDNHCSFCFIYQLPKGLRRSLYMKDDDYRLSFLYGNFTTLTRMTELDLERIVTERLSPLYVSIHATDPVVRARLLRNRRGATSLRFLRALLDAGIEVHGQIVLCPGLNDGEVLEDTCEEILLRFPELASVGIVPVGVGRASREPELHPIDADGARAVLETVAAWQETAQMCLGRRLFFASDELYILAGADLPAADHYEGFPQHENGVGISRAFVDAFRGAGRGHAPRRSGFFQWVDGAPAAGYRAQRQIPTVGQDGADGTEGSRPTAILTGRYGAAVLAPLLRELGRGDLRVVTVENRFFGGNIAVAGLLVGADLAAVLAAEPEGHRYLLPDVCLTEGRFLDGRTPADLPRPVEVVATDGAALRRVLDGPARRSRVSLGVRDRRPA